jgi:hypothetical protein
MKKLQLHYRKSVFVNYIIKVLCNLRLDSDLKIIFSGCQHEFRYWYKQYTRILFTLRLFAGEKTNNIALQMLL